MMLLTVWQPGHNQSMYYFLFQIANLEQQVLESNERLKSAEQQITDKQQHMDKLVSNTTVKCTELVRNRLDISQMSLLNKWPNKIENMKSHCGAFYYVLWCHLVAVSRMTL